MRFKDLIRPLPVLMDNLLGASVFFLPLVPPVSLMIWGLIIISWLATGQFKSSLKNLKQFPALGFFILLYVFYLAGMLWTYDCESGFEDLQVKVPLLIFPLLFSSLQFTRESYRKTVSGLVAGCCFAVLICLGSSIVNYSETGDTRRFFYTFFSLFLHPTYFTMYLNLALLFVSHQTIREETGLFRQGILRVLVFFILITGVILLNARLAMVTAFFTLLLFVIFESVRLKKTGRLSYRFLAQFISVALIFFFMLRVNNRFVQISDAVQEKSDTTAVLDTSTHIYYNSTLIRVALLKNGMKVFGDNFLFGVGTGDVKQESANQLSRSHLDYLSKHFTGAHNQYLQTAMTLGVFGLIILLATLIIPFAYYIRNKEYLFAAYVVVVMINALGDTILRASSLYFFVFFSVYFYVISKKEFSHFNRLSRDV